jgi:hypothetical protein
VHVHCIVCLQLDLLNNLISTTLVSIEEQRDALVVDLRTAEGYIANNNFTAIDESLKFAQGQLNENGSAIVGAFVNDTADSIYDDVISFSTQTVDAVENDIGNSLPLYDAITTLIDATCVQLVSRFVFDRVRQTETEFIVCLREGSNVDCKAAGRHTQGRPSVNF